MSELEDDEARDRRRRIMSTTFDQRLEWLDQALEVARETGALERARRKKTAQGVEQL